MKFIPCWPAACLGALLLALPCSPGAPAPKPRIKHIILFIGDGMQLENEVAASQYLFGQGRNLSFHGFPYHAPVTTWDVTAYNRNAARAGKPSYRPWDFEPAVGYSIELGGKRPFPDNPLSADYYFLRLASATDSASSATAWATGCKTDDGNIAWLPGDPAGGALKTIAELVREKNGAAIGVVSSVPFTHATPAAHVAHNTSRNNYYSGYAGYTGLGIAEEIVFHTRPDVVIGGGHPMRDNPSFSPYRGYISRTVYNALKDGSAGYAFVERRAGVPGGPALLAAAEAAAAEGKKFFGLFGGAGGNFEPPLPVNLPGSPTFLRNNQEDPLLVEATLAALKVLSKDPDGFFVMIEQGQVDWANHGNNYPWMIGAMWDLHESVQAALRFVDQPGDSVTWDNTLLIVTADHATGYLRLAREDGLPLLGAGELPPTTGRITFNAQGEPVYYPAGAVAFYGTTGHTDEMTMLYAFGAGINFLATRQGGWYRGTQILDNTQLFQAMAEAAGLAPHPRSRAPKPEPAVPQATPGEALVD